MPARRAALHPAPGCQRSPSRESGTEKEAMMASSVPRSAWTHTFEPVQATAPAPVFDKAPVPGGLGP